MSQNDMKIEVHLSSRKDLTFTQKNNVTMLNINVRIQSVQKIDVNVVEHQC